MKEYFVVTNSFAAPFVSDRGERYVMAASPEAALEQVAATYAHPCGLYAAVAYLSHKDSLQNAKPAARWICNAEIAVREATSGKDAYTLRRTSSDTFEIDGVLHKVADPKGGRVYQEPQS